MPTSTLIKNAQVQTEVPFTGDVLITGGKIAAMGHDLALPDHTQVIDANQQTLLPGLIDVHVHFREPGFTAKETIKTGAAASAHGGYTTVCAMPNLNPVPDNVEDLKALIAKNQRDAKIHVLQWAAITKGLRSEDLTDYAAMMQAGAFGFSNDGVGVQDAATMYQAMQGAKSADAPLAAHIEDAGLMNHGVINAGKVAEKMHLPGISNQTESAQLARDLELAAATGVHYHACHISTRQSVALIRAAKKSGVHVTAEVTPHHLLLADSDIPGDNPMFKMNPPLRTRADQLALLEGLDDGTLDMVATDHAPHTAAEKTGSFKTAAFGIVGIETSFALLYTQLVKGGMFSLKQLLNWMSTAPAKEFGIAGGSIAIGQPADLTLMDLTHSYKIDPATWLSKGHNSPFIGREVYGQTKLTIAGGSIAYAEEETL